MDLNDLEVTAILIFKCSSLMVNRTSGHGKRLGHEEKYHSLALGLVLTLFNPFFSSEENEKYAFNYCSNIERPL